MYYKQPRSILLAGQLDGDAQADRPSVILQNYRRQPAALPPSSLAAATLDQSSEPVALRVRLEVDLTHSERAMSRVFKVRIDAEQSEVWDHAIEECVLKIFLGCDDGRRQRRFEVEASAYNKAEKHQGTILPKVYGRCEIDGWPCLLLEYVDLPPLRVVGPLAMAAGRQFEVIDTMRAAFLSMHESGVLVVDVNKRDVLVGLDDKTCVVRLIDLGEAILFDPEAFLAAKDLGNIPITVSRGFAAEFHQEYEAFAGAFPGKAYIYIDGLYSWNRNDPYLVKYHGLVDRQQHEAQSQPISSPATAWTATSIGWESVKQPEHLHL